MSIQPETDRLVRDQLTELLVGGFAPNVILLREFRFDRAGVILPGLHFSAWVLLGHMQARQRILLDFMRDPLANPDVWPDAHWPANHQPAGETEWHEAIDAFAAEMQEMIRIVQDPDIDLFRVHPNGKTLSWAAMTALHHNAYHIGQLKTVGRQLGVW